MTKTLKAKKAPISNQQRHLGRDDLERLSPTLLLKLNQANHRLRQFLSPAELLAGLRLSAETGQALLLQPGHSGYAWSDRTVPLAMVFPSETTLSVRLKRGHSYRNMPPTPAVWPELRGFPKGDVAKKIAAWCAAEDVVVVERSAAMGLPPAQVECRAQLFPV